MAAKETAVINKPSLEELLTEAHPMSFYTCKILLGSDEAAIVVSADAYKRVLKNPEKIPDEESFPHWIKNVAVVACSSFLRRQDEGIFLKNPPRPNLEKLELFHNRNLNVSATAKYVENRIKLMPLPQRFAAVCYYCNGMTVAQISTVMAVPTLRVKELMRSAAAEISALTREFNDKRVTTTKLDISALLDVCAASAECPQLDLSSLLDKEHTENVAEEIPEKSQKSGKKAFLISACLLLLIAGIGVFVANSLFGTPLKNNGVAESSSITSYTSAETVGQVSSLSQDVLESELIAVSSEAETEEPAVMTPLYNITHETYYDVDGDKIRECAYTYENGELKRVQTATPMFKEDLKYKWNKKGTKRTTTDGEGNVCEVAWYDKHSNPTKLKYGDKEDETVKYKWTYTYDDKGRIATAKFKGVNSGKYSYTYTEKGQIATVTTTYSDDKYTTAYTYDENGMVGTKVETDFDGTRTETFYTYDYEGMTFTAAVSDGTKIEGRIA